ncbi:putative peroxiredoxin [Paractinoplanes abujensis]|uniref:Alkyl hydroperoxide reductase E n=1 Tax=Paractinoplanes abujensis TaxID=882441 RepID=A0A7W7CTS7_9ACTN|nr:peroxiredoxin [Actinoplanes abujensis]MBB4694547.1 peroxiredoxin (alkyl hydroperoxide reductase subunit C) [Actinoplanes abujensis]GID20239.1 putative peroxiredoxin [Actinoplanes abujensis]
MTVPVGAPAPEFSLKDQNNQDVRLADFRGRKAVLLVFYPFTFTGTCQGELTEIRDHLPDYQNDDVQVLAVSVDSVYSHKVWAVQEGFDFPLLADFWPHGAVAQAYGVFHEAGGMANRGTFLIDRDGVVRFAEMTGPGETRDQKAWRAALAEL